MSEICLRMGQTQRWLTQIEMGIAQAWKNIDISESILLMKYERTGKTIKCQH